MNVLRGRRRAGAVVAGVLAVSVVVLALTLNAQGPSLAGGERAAKPVSFGREPLWDMEKVRGAVIRGRSVVVVGEAAKSGGTGIGVLDAETGEKRWALRDEEPLGRDGARLGYGYSGVDPGDGSNGRPLLVGDGDGDGDGDGGDWGVLVSYEKRRRGTDPEHGVAALSGKDGRLLWKRALPGAHDVDLRDVEDDRILVGTEGRSFDDIASYLLDADREGRTVWKHRGNVVALAEEVALGQAGGNRARDAAAPFVFALDARTGRKKWDLAGRHFESWLSGAVDGRAVVHTVAAREFGDAKHPGGYVLDTATGAKTDDLGRASYSCAADVRDRLLACVEDDEPRLITIRAGRHSAPVHARIGALEGDPAYYDRDVDSVRDGRVYVSSGSPYPKRAAVDRLGGTLREPLPGGVLDVAGGYAVVLSEEPGGQERMAVHRVTARR